MTDVHSIHPAHTPGRRGRVWRWYLLPIVTAVGLFLWAALLIGGKLHAYNRLRQGYFPPSDYVMLFTGQGWARYGFPPALSPSAGEVILYAPAAAPSLLPSPDQYVEVRMVISPSEAQDLIASSAAIDAKLTKPNSSYSSIINMLNTVDDQNRTTPLPPAFRTFFLANPSGYNVGCVTINPTTGEVVYWIFES